jgi:hypothetical protein
MSVGYYSYLPPLIMYYNCRFLYPVILASVGRFADRVFLSAYIVS